MSIEQFKAAIARSDRAGVNRAAAALLDTGARLGGLWSGVARALAFNGELLLAIRAAEALARERGAPQDILALATTLLQAGRPRAALGVAQSLRGGEAGAAVEHFAGVCALQLGEFDAARRFLEAAVAMQPQSGPSWLSLAALPGADDAGLIDRVCAVLARPGLAASDEAPLHFAHGTLLDRAGDHDAAFAAFARGAQVARRNRPYDRAGDLAEATALMSGDAAALDALAGAGADASRAIFVSGPPRSGTTLVEQILVSHSTVADGGETGWGRIVSREIGGRDFVALQRYHARTGTLTGLAQLYAHLAGLRFGSGRFVDKSLDLARMAATYAAILPDAPMIWLDRDPLDVAWSNYRTWFARGADWSLSLDDMAFHLALEDRLADHWAVLLGERFRRVSYQALVDGPERQVAGIAAHCGLAMEPAMLSPHETRRAVTSASFVQVRQPINRAGLGSAQPYARHLGPFVDAYERARRTLSA